MPFSNLVGQAQSAMSASSTMRKARKLRRDPTLFFRDFFAKRVPGLGLPEGRQALSSQQLRQRALVDKDHAVSDAILDACTYLEQSGHPLVAGSTDATSGLILAYHPVAFGNPFQQMLYSAGTSEGVVTFPLRELDDLLEVRWPTRVVCHIHWLNGVLRGTSSADLARERIDSFAAKLDKLKAHGVSLVWTVHNVLPHNATLPAMECELRELVIDRADAIHIMNERTRAETELFFRLPRDKTFLCEHPSYEGVYPDYVDRDVARYNLGLSKDACVFLCFGSIQEYKGLREILAAFQEVATRSSREVHLVVAGIPSDKALALHLAAEYGACDNISLHLRKVPTEEVQHFFRAADFVACPYKMTLNSGAAILAHSFGKPIIAPDVGAMGELIADGLGIALPSMDRHCLVDTLLAATTIDAVPMHEAIAAASERRAPRNVSTRFFAALREQLG